MTFCAQYMRQSMQNIAFYSFQNSILCPISSVSVVVSPIVVRTVSA